MRNPMTCTIIGRFIGHLTNAIQGSLIRVLNCPMIAPQRLLICPVNLVSNPMNCLVRLLDYIILAIFDALTP